MYIHKRIQWIYSDQRYYKWNLKATGKARKKLSIHIRLYRSLQDYFRYKKFAAGSNITPAKAKIPFQWT